jgi:hypothetical protein
MALKKRAAGHPALEEKLAGLVNDLLAGRELGKADQTLIQQAETELGAH